MARRLPDELIALVHHVELTEARWWDKALQRFLIGIVSTTGAIHPAELPPILRREYGIDITIAATNPHVAALVATGEFVELADGRVKLSETTAAQVRSDIKRAREQEGRLQERFLMALSEAGVDTDPTRAWKDLQDKVLTPLVQELGARTYELIQQVAAPNAPPNFMVAVGSSLDAYDEREKSAIIHFLDPDDPDVRAFVLRTLSAYFFAEASALSEDTLGRLQEAQGKQHELRVLVDTNFLFSVLRLHDNPTNEIAETADALLTRIRDQIDIHLYVLPITVQEARSTLGAQIEALSGIRLSRNLARAVVDESEMHGLTQRYLQEAATSEKPLTPEDFFGPYEKNLVAVLRERGVELFNESMDPYRVDQAIIDDLLIEEEYQKANRPRGPKPYEANLHDMVLWHFVSRKRPQVVESPLDARYWIVTDGLRLTL